VPDINLINMQIRMLMQRLEMHSVKSRNYPVIIILLGNNK